MKIIRILGPAAGGETPHNGRFLVRYNPHSPNGELWLDSTDDIAKATRFPDLVEFTRLYRTVSNVEPRRADGKPNRPITFLTLSIEEEPK